MEGVKKHGVDYIVVRNSKMMNRRKLNDNYTCQACGFRLKVGSIYVIECHHKNPVSLGERKTCLDDLISLCPICHRIAHINKDPLDIVQIRRIRETPYR